MPRKIAVEIVGDASSLSRAFKKAEADGKKFGRSFAAVTKAAGVGALAIGAGVAVGLKKAIDSAVEHEQALAQTRAALESTGKVANVTAEQITGLADAIEKKTGVDDLAIQSAENLLLTFTQVRNETGKGNDIFTQATKTIADMSVALGQDTKSSAIQLGKALNDPIKGVTALQRVGVSFTKAQKDQIKSLVASGKTMDAQKLILKELKTEFGGSAEAAGKTFAGQLNILKARLDDVAQRVGEALIPALTSALDAFSAVLPVVTRFADQVIQRLQPAFAAVAGFVEKTLVPLFREELLPIFEERLLPILRDVGDMFTTTVQRIGAVLEAHREDLVTIWENVSAALQALWKIARPILKLLFEEILPRAIGITLTALAKLTTAIRKIIEFAKSFGKALAAIIAAPINAVIKAINALKIPAFTINPPGPGKITSPGIDLIPGTIKPIGGGGMNIQTVNVYGVQNPREFHKQLQREAGRRSSTRRGPNAGNSMGFAN